MSAALDARLGTELARLKAAKLYRTRRVVEGGHGVAIRVDGKSCLNFCSNDYLGLAADPRVAEAARAALAATGTGSGAAALISGYNREHARLEEALADFVRRPRALLFSSGWAANLGVPRALLGRGDALIADELNHASLIDGGRLSGARYRRVAHRDLEGFERALQEAGTPDSAFGIRGSPVQSLLISDSVFSMDGDLADVPGLARLARRYGAALMIDDAHGFGVLGANGRGALEHFVAHCGAPEVGPEIYVATLGKALGCAGAFVAGSATLIEFLIQRARSWVFSTAPPPAIAAAARCALGICASREGAQRRAQLFANVARFREGARAIGIALAEQQAPTPIQPLVLGDEARALKLSRHLFERGFWVVAIRPPTVPAGTARLRLTLSASHTQAQIEALLEALAEGLRLTEPAAA